MKPLNAINTIFLLGIEVSAPANQFFAALVVPNENKI